MCSAASVPVPLFFETKVADMRKIHCLIHCLFVQVGFLLGFTFSLFHFLTYSTGFNKGCPLVSYNKDSCFVYTALQRLQLLFLKLGCLARGSVTQLNV